MEGRFFVSQLIYLLWLHIALEGALFFIWILLKLLYLRVCGALNMDSPLKYVFEKDIKNESQNYSDIIRQNHDFSLGQTCPYFLTRKSTWWRIISCRCVTPGHPTINDDLTINTRYRSSFSAVFFLICYSTRNKLSLFSMIF